MRVRNLCTVRVNSASLFKLCFTFSSETNDGDVND